MGIFKNGIGRPSNETLKKRRFAYFAIAIGAIAIIGGGGFFIHNIMNKESMESSKKNITTTNDSNGPIVKLTAYKLGSNGKKTGNALKTVTNGNLEFTNWVNYQYGLVIDAKSTDSTIKSIKWEITTTQKATYAEANTAASWKAGNGGTTWNYSKASVSKEVGIYADGVRLGRITVTDANGKSRIVRVRFNLDSTAPILKFSISGTKSGSSYYSGAKVTATCTDNLSGVTYMNTYDTQDTSDKRTFSNTKAVKSKSQTILLVTRGNARNITTTCKDALGNSTGNKKSSSYKIIYYSSNGSSSSKSSSSSSSSSSKSTSGKRCTTQYYCAVGKSVGGQCQVKYYTCPSGYTMQGGGPSATCSNGKRIRGVVDAYYYVKMNTRQLCY